MANEKAERTPNASIALRMTRHFSAPPDALFRAWTDPTAFAQWMGPPGVTARDVRIDLRVSGRYSLVMDGEDGNAYPLSGEYREIDPPKRLAFTLEWGHGDLAGLEMLVSVDFIAERDGTIARGRPRRAASYPPTASTPGSRRRTSYPARTAPRLRDE